MCVGCDASDHLIDHYWSDCAPLRLLMGFAWGAKVTPSCMHNMWGITARLDVVASLYSFFCEVYRLIRAEPPIPITRRRFEELAVSVRKLHTWEVVLMILLLRAHTTYPFDLFLLVVSACTKLMF